MQTIVPLNPEIEERLAIILASMPWESYSSALKEGDFKSWFSNWAIGIKERALLANLLFLVLGLYPEPIAAAFATEQESDSYVLSTQSVKLARKRQ